MLKLKSNQRGSRLGEHKGKETDKNFFPASSKWHLVFSCVYCIQSFTAPCNAYFKEACRLSSTCIYHTYIRSVMCCNQNSWELAENYLEFNFCLGDVLLTATSASYFLGFRDLRSHSLRVNSVSFGSNDLCRPLTSGLKSSRGKPSTAFMLI